MNLVYMKDHPTVLVQCVVAEKPFMWMDGHTNASDSVHYLEHEFEMIFGKVNFVRPIENVETGKLTRFHVMMASAEIAAIVLQNAECWTKTGMQYSIEIAELAMQLFEQPALTVPSLYEPPVLANNQTSPFDCLKLTNMMRVFDYLDIDSICSLAEADSQMRKFVDEYIFASKDAKTKYGLFSDHNLRSNIFRRRLYFLGPHLESVRIPNFNLDIKTVHDITCVLQTCPKSKSLEISRYSLSIHDLVVLSRFKSPLISLTLRFFHIEFKQWTNVILNWPNLDELIMYHCASTHLEYLLEPCHNLRVFHFLGVSMSSPKLVEDLVNRNKNSLCSLMFYFNPCTDYDIVLSLFRRCPYLECVGFDLSNLREPNELQQLRHLPHLTGVSIFNWHMLDLPKFLKPLIELNLETLALEMNTVHKLDKLSDTLTMFCTLHELEISIWNHSASDLIDIIVQMPNLEEFVLGNYSELQEHDLEELREYASLKNIRFVDVKHLK